MGVLCAFICVLCAVCIYLCVVCIYLCVVLFTCACTIVYVHVCQSIVCTGGSGSGADDFMEAVAGGVEGGLKDISLGSTKVA